VASLFDIPVRGIDGSEQTLEPYRGRILLIVNVASRCGFTPQYDGLESLYRKFKDRGFAVLGFPCNQFLGQESGNEAEIQQFCSLKFNVSFPMFAKIDVNGKDTHPLYRLLKDAAPGSLGTRSIKWNFTKFLVDRDGNVVRRYGPFVKPARIEMRIERLFNLVAR
jgi:glutathione peroxidase